jgi:hypothetical protein
VRALDRQEARRESKAGKPHGRPIRVSGSQWDAEATRAAGVNDGPADRLFRDGGASLASIS